MTTTPNAANTCASSVANSLDSVYSMARGRKNTPVEGQLDIFDALMDIDTDEHELTPGEDTTNADNEHHSGVRPEVRPEAIQQDFRTRKPIFTTC